MFRFIVFTDRKKWNARNATKAITSLAEVNIDNSKYAHINIVRLLVSYIAANHNIKNLCVSFLCIILLIFKPTFLNLLYTDLYHI